MNKGLILINNNVEDVEALATKALLTRAGIVVESFTLNDNLLIETAYGTKVYVDHLVEDLNLNEYNFLILPGGKHVFEHVGKSEKLNEIILNFNKRDKLIAAICAAPLFLSELNLLKDKEFVAFPSVIEEINGIYLPNKRVVRSDNIITSRSAGTVYDFVFEIVNYLTNVEVLNELQEEIVF